MTTTSVKTAIATYPHTQGLKDGRVSVPGLRFEHVEVSPIVGAFRRMCRSLEFDVSEMAITHVSDGAGLRQALHRSARLRHAPVSPCADRLQRKAGVASPKDLEGKKVGVRAYTVTTGVWARGILATERVGMGSPRHDPGHR